MKVKLESAALLILLTMALAGCGGDAASTLPVPAAPTIAPAAAQPSGANDHILIQHILIGFKDAVGFNGNPPAKAAGRTQDQAKTLAYDLLNQAKSGADFDQLVAANTDDQAPGIYALANTGVTPGQGEYSPELDGARLRQRRLRPAGWPDRHSRLRPGDQSLRVAHHKETTLIYSAPLRFAGLSQHFL